MSKIALQHLARADKTLGRLIAKVGPCLWEPDRRCSLFQTLVHSVAHQQLNGTAAKTILRRMKALFPGKRFPSPQDLLDMPDAKLRGAGLSRSKIAAMKDIAANTLSGLVPASRAIGRMSDEEIVERLTAIRGVGPWTVHMLLIFKLGRPDVLPTTDYGVRKGFATAFKRAELPTPRELLEHGERWRPYRSFAAWYLWRALDSD